MILSGGKNEKPKNKNSFFLRSGGGIILSFILISLLILASCQNKPIIIYPGITTPPVVTSNPKAEAAADAIEYLRSDSFWDRVAKSISAPDQTLTVDTIVTKLNTQNLSMNRISVAKPSGTRAETVRYQIVMTITFTKFTDGTVSIPSGSIVATMTTDEVPDSETDVKISDYSITTTNVAFSNQSSSGVVSITGAEGTTKTTVKLSGDKTKVETANDIKLDVIAESKDSTSSVSVSVGGSNVNITEIEDNANNAFAGGLGTEARPYIVGTITQFNAMVDYGDGYFKLGNNLWIPASLTFNDFYGNLNGDNYTITYQNSTEEASELFYALRDGAVIKNLNIDINGIKKSLAFCTEGTVLLENVNISGTFETTGNNSGPYICYLGYSPNDAQSTRLPADLTLRNCTNEVDIIDPTGTSWGKAPFIHGYAMPDVENQCTLTLDGCVNNGSIFGGKVGWVFGNQSGVENVGKVTIKNCSNGSDGSVVGVIDNGDYSWNDKTFRPTDDVDSSFKNMTKKLDVATVQSVTAKTSTATINVTPSNLPPETARIQFVVGYQVTGYTGMATTDTRVHMTYYFIYDGGEPSTKTHTLPSLTAIDSSFDGSPANAETGEIVTINEKKYVYIGNVLEGEEGTVHSCLDRPSVEIGSRVHSATPESIYIVCYDANNSIIGHNKATIEN